MFLYNVTLTRWSNLVTPISGFLLQWEWKCQLLSCAWLSAAPQTGAHQAPLSLGFSRQEYWSELPCPSPRDLHPETELRSPALQADSNCVSYTMGRIKNLLQGIILPKKFNLDLIMRKQSERLRLWNILLDK